MNNKRRDYYPVIGYLLLLVVVWLFSWLSDIVSTFMGTDFGFASLVSSEGIRWAMRNALSSLENVAWGSIMLFIVAWGLMQGSGITRLLSRLFKREKLTKMEIRSLLFSTSALLLYSLLLYVVTFSEWNLLLGVTGTVEGSAFISGLPLLLFFAVLIATLVYGFMYGNYRSPIDVVSSAGNTFTTSVPALMALIPAAGILASIEYVGLFTFWGLTEGEVKIISAVLYLIPFMHVFLGKKRYGES